MLATTFWLAAHLEGELRGNTHFLQVNQTPGIPQVPQTNGRHVTVVPTSLQ